MNDTGRDMNQRPLGNGPLDPIKNDATTAIQYVVELRGSLVVMELGTVDVHRMCPCRRRKGHILVADKAVAPTTGAVLSWGMALMANQ